MSDITYLPVGNDFGYLSLITNAYSHKVVGFYLSQDLSAQGLIMALKMALKNNPQRENLIHHSDRIAVLQWRLHETFRKHTREHERAQRPVGKSCCRTHERNLKRRTAQKLF